MDGLTSQNVMPADGEGLLGKALEKRWCSLPLVFFFKTQFLCQAICTQRTRRDPSNRRLNEHGIYIRHCQESNSQPVPSQAGADTTRPQCHPRPLVFCTSSIKILDLVILQI